MNEKLKYMNCSQSKEAQKNVVELRQSEAEKRPAMQNLKKKTNSLEIKKKLMVNNLKIEPVSEAPLHIYDRKVMTELHTDASKGGFSEILLQSLEAKLHTVYCSAKNSPRYATHVERKVNIYVANV